ncbi:MAG: hypothetical protein ACLGHT_09330 [Acidimicrobiia bacterium]
MTLADATAAAAARRFIDAIAWGEHHTVWDLLSNGGRETVLRIALTRGMDADLAARLGAGDAAAGERDDFLKDLVNGLRADLLGTDLDSLLYDEESGSAADRTTVVMSAPLVPALGAGRGLPVGSVELVRQGEGWRVERLRPRPGDGGPTAVAGQ